MMNDETSLEAVSVTTGGPRSSSVEIGMAHTLDFDTQAMATLEARRCDEDRFELTLQEDLHVILARMQHAAPNKLVPIPTLPSPPKAVRIAPQYVQADVTTQPQLPIAPPPQPPVVVAVEPTQVAVPHHHVVAAVQSRSRLEVTTLQAILIIAVGALSGLAVALVSMAVSGL